MTAHPDLGFGKFVPGFDFLQNLAKGTAQAAPPLGPLSSWVAPTLNVEELEKRISELKAVQFWLDQNGKALAATIQALEVQKMTLATLRDMNVNLGEMAESLTARTAQAVDDMQKMAQPAGAPGDQAGATAQAPGDGSGAGPVDPLRWWGALTQQFQEIAASAMQDTAAAATAAPTAKAASRKTPAPRKAAAPKTAARKTAARKGSAAR